MQQNNTCLEFRRNHQLIYHFKVTQGINYNFKSAGVPDSSHLFLCLVVEASYIVISHAHGPPQSRKPKHIPRFSYSVGFLPLYFSNHRGQEKHKPQTHTKQAAYTFTHTIKEKKQHGSKCRQQFPTQTHKTEIKEFGFFSIPLLSC